MPWIVLGNGRREIMDNKGVGRKGHREEGESQEEKWGNKAQHQNKNTSQKWRKIKALTLISAFDYDYDLLATKELEETSFNKSKVSD